MENIENDLVVSPNVHEGQHLRRAASTHPHGEKDDEEGAGEHHPSGVCRGVSDGQGESHGPTQTWKKSRAEIRGVYWTVGLIRTAAALGS